MISVVMPAYNAEKFIEPAIQSILDQTYKDFELIVVDDGSTDRTGEIIQRFAEKDPRVKAVKGQHEGVGQAMNLGIEHAIYPWIAVMHSDDIALPERLEKQIKAAMSDPEVVIWGSDGYHINTHGNVLSRFRVGPTSKRQCKEMRYGGHMVQSIHPTVLLNKEIVEKVGKYDGNFNGSEDIELFDRMLNHGYLVTIPEYLLKYRIHSSSLSMTKHHKIAVFARFVLARQAHRNQTGEELSFETFLQQQAKRSRLSKFHDFRLSMGDLYYRQAGILFGEKQYFKMAFLLLASALMRPMYPIKRAWKQVLSPASRKAIKQLQNAKSV